MYCEASKHYERAYNLYRVEGYHFHRCMELLEEIANMSILQNDFKAAAEDFLTIFEAYYKNELLRFTRMKYFAKACLSFLVENPKISITYIEEKVDNASLSYTDIDMVKGIRNAVQKKNYDSFKSLIGVKYSSKLDTDYTLRVIVRAIEKKYFLVANGSEKKNGKLPAANEDINLENQSEDEKIDKADQNQSKIISKDNSPTAQSMAKSSANAQGKE
ncbi:MAG: hypothetical protein MHMPM18_001237 [Marteilia pararefringens]